MHNKARRTPAEEIYHHFIVHYSAYSAFITGKLSLLWRGERRCETDVLGLFARGFGRRAAAARERFAGRPTRYGATIFNDSAQGLFTERTHGARLPTCSGRPRAAGELARRARPEGSALRCAPFWCWRRAACRRAPVRRHSGARCGQPRRGPRGAAPAGRRQQAGGRLHPRRRAAGRAAAAAATKCRSPCTSCGYPALRRVA